MRIPYEIFEKVKRNNVISLITSPGRINFEVLGVKFVPGHPTICPPPSPRKFYTIFPKFLEFWTISNRMLVIKIFNM